MDNSNDDASDNHDDSVEGAEETVAGGAMADGKEENDTADPQEMEKVEKDSWVWNYIYKLKNGPLRKMPTGASCEHVCKICAN